MLPNRFEDKVAIVTGGGSGIGRRIALRLAGEGAHVALFERDAERGEEVVREIRERGGGASLHVCDVGEGAEVAAAVAAVRAEHSRIDVLINNAGIAHIGSLEDTSGADLDRLYRVNVKGVYHGMHACIGPMTAQGGGSSSTSPPSPPSSGSGTGSPTP